jgi:hypothetical protein
MREIIEDLNKQMQEKMEEIEKLRKEEVILSNSEEMEKWEQRVGEITDKVAGLLVGMKVQETLASSKMQEEAQKLVKSHRKRMKSQGMREVEIKGVRGESIRIKSTYYSPKSSGRKRGIGIYPGLVLMGIYEGYTPAVVSEVSTMTVLVGSFEEAGKVLESRGVDIDKKALRAITYRTAQRAKLQQQSENFSFGENQSLSGRRVVISSDGGRIRIRKNKRGQKTKKGRNRYSTSWREPKLMIIYVVNEKAEMDRSYAPFIEGTLRGPDAVFALLNYYLSKLEIKKADKILFIADGAPWIWRRLPSLLRNLGLSASQVYEAIDFYHAVEHLGRVAALRKSWSATERKRWVKRQRKLLLQGRVSEVINAVEELCRGRSGKAISRERNYFLKNSHRMDYARLSAMKLPIGSGAIESAIRRVVNLRLKGPGIFWHRENAEAMLMLRSYYKAGRWNLLKQLAFAPSLPAAA